MEIIVCDKVKLYRLSTTVVLLGLEERFVWTESFSFSHLMGLRIAFTGQPIYCVYILASVVDVCTGWCLPLWLLYIFMIMCLGRGVSLQIPQCGRECIVKVNYFFLKTLEMCRAVLWFLVCMMWKSLCGDGRHFVFWCGFVEGNM